ncbi:ATP-binding cassette domain-containing protein [Leifsonia sp. SIMBA_070]|uniref:ABC transporter ATP-binding protein n=1 Tax=Leifsonia sp. SIMBA_070 TaxID=3085810 RepID=UPI003979DEEF
MDAVIDVSGLVKRFGRVHALDGLDLTVSEGTVHGFLGPNGAGKSTTIRVLLGLARADGGRAALFGRDPWRDAVTLHRRIAYVPGDVSLWPNLSGGEAIDLLGRLRGGTTDKAAYAARKKRLLEVFELDPTKKGRAYSKGNRQKVALVAAFATPADLYILDEPTSGLDPLMEAVFDAEIHRVAGEGATVLLSSHILSEVEQLCDRVSIIRAGRTVETGTLDELRHLTRTEISFRADGMREGALAQLPGAHEAQVREGRVRFTADSDALGPVLEALSRMDVRGLTVAPPSLEELFLRHYGDDPSTTMADAGSTTAGASR